ncbi:hypothetical protein [Rhizobium paranaense]|uniref:Uncharacterized protein n=1 Tax=Rhizobium paranaense TaxID=1650438 RepID=A0A7W9D357_9HYPH|nr:hypothetical protein [Rhizobium paranaense]MBB5576017.1 hypothetical protein [Rhizobium paranaense]
MKLVAVIVVTFASLPYRYARRNGCRQKGIARFLHRPLAMVSADQGFLGHGMNAVGFACWPFAKKKFKGLFGVVDRNVVAALPGDDRHRTIPQIFGHVAVSSAHETDTLRLGSHPERNNQKYSLEHAKTYTRS